jgi:hypothetical protein
VRYKSVLHHHHKSGTQNSQTTRDANANSNANENTLPTDRPENKHATSAQNSFDGGANADLKRNNVATDSSRSKNATTSVGNADTSKTDGGSMAAVLDSWVVTYVTGNRATRHWAWRYCYKWMRAKLRKVRHTEVRKRANPLATSKEHLDGETDANDKTNSVSSVYL